MKSEAGFARMMGPEATLALEAAAGAGKTHFAIELAGEVVRRQAKPWERVLFLSHTNSARDEIASRLREMSGRITASTLDSFAMRILSPYATLWSLPDPLAPPADGGQSVGDWFAEVRHKTVVLLRGTPALADAVVCRYPFIVADEHQDASREQHELLMILSRAGARIRFFGDALQAIMTFSDDVPGWEALIGSIETERLEGSWRWASNPALGEWVASARNALLGRQEIDLARAPECVQVVRAPGASAPLPSVRAALAQVAPEGPVVVLVRNNADARSLAASPGLGLDLFEGSNLSAVDYFLNTLAEAEGDPTECLEAVLQLASTTGYWADATGAVCLKATLSALAEGAVGPSSSSSRAAEEVCRALLEHPGLYGGLRAAEALVARGELLGWTLHSRRSIAVLQDLSSGGAITDRLRQAVHDAQRALADAELPERCVSTIHKAKGRQFPHAFIASVGISDFRTSSLDRSLLYVALSRPVDRLTLVVPDRPSALIGLT